MPHYVYILASRRGVIYIGSTNRLAVRIEQHRAGVVRGFTQKYKAHKLVYVEVADSAEAAFALERQTKGWKRDRKVELIESLNPYWEDLTERYIA